MISVSAVAKENSKFPSAMKIARYDAIPASRRKSYVRFCRFHPIAWYWWLTAWLQSEFSRAPGFAPRSTERNSRPRQREFDSALGDRTSLKVYRQRRWNTLAW